MTVLKKFLESTKDGLTASGYIFSPLTVFNMFLLVLLMALCFQYVLTCIADDTFQILQIKILEGISQRIKDLCFIQK